MIQNVTEERDITTSISSYKHIIVYSVLLFNSMVGVMGNSVAMFILTSSVKIRKSKLYVLLMNQCLLDFTTTLFMIIYIPLKYFVQWSRMTGSWDLIMCHVIYSQLYITMPIFSSSYNLVVLSVERMTSILWPVIHKVRCTRRLTLKIAMSTWVFGFGIATAFALPVNGIDPVKRKCYYWDNFPSLLNSKIYSVIYNIFYFLLPFIMMLTSYAVMFTRISSRRMRLGVKLNVARMLASCVLLYLCCHFLKVTLIMITCFSTNKMSLKSSLFGMGTIMVQVNSVVNPFIYSLQYMDYKKELRRQLSRITASIKRGTRSESIHVEGTYSSSVKHDKQ